LIAALIVIALLLTGAFAGYLVVRDRVDEVLEDGGIGGVGDCARFQTSLMFMTMSNLMTMGSDELSSQLGEVRSIAPAAVRDDIDVIASALGEAVGEGLMGAMPGGGGEQTPEEQRAAEAEVEAILESPEVQQASDNIDAWAAETCGGEATTGGFFPRGLG
jgi:hypothetical protein